MRNSFFDLLLCIILTGYDTGIAQENEITADEIRVHVRYLASDELEGRRSGTEGNRKAAQYISHLMNQYGLTPAGDSGTYFQSFDFVSSLKPGDTNTLSFEGNSLPDRRIELRADIDFRPLGLTTNERVSAPLVFAGYGISAPDRNYDDYEKINVAGKIVVALRYSPEGNGVHSGLYRYSTFRSKARTARDKGAKGLIIVAGPADDPEDGLVQLAYDRAFAGSGIPAISMKRESLDKVLAGLGRNTRSIQDSIRLGNKPVVFDIPGVTVHLATDVVNVMSKSANVVGYLQGTDPKNQTVVVGAHFDHLGHGGSGSGSLQPESNAIHNGADDNASGTAGLLELAQALAAKQPQQKRSIVFIAFSGEELGTLGSEYYVNHPFVPLTQTVAMFNLDMVGRLEKKALTVYGTGTSPEWAPLLTKYNADTSFSFKSIADGFGPSDHAEFYGKNIPVLFFFTGLHSDYHRPSDDWEKLNYSGEEKIVRLVYNIIEEVDSQAEKPLFASVPSSSPTIWGGGDSPGLSVTLGIIPDYGTSSDGMRIGGVRPGGPAEKAGLASGDLIVKISSRKILNIYDYMGILSELGAGSQVEIEILREGKPLNTKATIEKRK